MVNTKKNFIWNLLGTTANAFVSLFFLIIVNRINGTSEAGIFSYAFSIACLFYIIALYYNRVYQVADTKNTYTKNQFISNRIMTSFITVLISVIFTLVNRFDFYKSSIIIFLTLFKILEAVSDCFHAFFQKKDQLYLVGEYLTIKAILGILFFLILDYLTKNILFSILGLIFINMIGLFIEIKKYFKIYKEKFKWQTDKMFSLLKSVWPLFLFSFLNIYLNNCQKYILEYFMNEEFQTILGIIIMPATMLSLCGQYLIGPLLNELSLNYQKKQLTIFSKTFTKMNIAFIFMGMFIFLMAFIFGIPVLNIIYNINLDSYKIAFLTIIIGAIFYALSTIISNGLVIMNKNKEQLGIFIVSSLISTLISIILIKTYYLNGASVAYLMTMIIHFILSYLVFKVNLKEGSEVNENSN